MKQYEIGERIGGEFEVLDVFGGESHSGMGVVYLVKHREIADPFILKTFQKQLKSNVLEQFVKEAKVWVNIGFHNNIVRAYWVREIVGQLFVAAEFIPPDEQGRNKLTDFLGVGQLRDEVVARWSTQFCYGMRHALSKGLVAHRDIKPDNLMVDSAWNLRITDFGLAKSVDSKKTKNWLHGKLFGKKSTSVNATKTGVAMGTLPYMAPEQFIDSSSVDSRSDIYAFGIVLYQMATGGHYPYAIDQFAPTTDFAFFLAHTEQEPTPINSAFFPIIRRCLCKEPNGRYQTFESLLGALANLATENAFPLPPDLTRPQEAEDLYAKAQSLVALGDSNAALKAIELYIHQLQDDPSGWLEKGRIHFEREELGLALEATRKSIYLDPTSTHAWNNLGILLGRTGAPLEETKEALYRALYLDPGNSAAMVNLVSPLVLEKSYKELVDLLAVALHLYPDKPLLFEKAKGLVPELIRSKEFEAAYKLLESISVVRPEDIDSLHNLGLFALDRGNYDQAVKCFEKVLGLSSDGDLFAVKQLAKLYFYKKKAKECLTYCEIMLENSYEPLLAISMKAQIFNILRGYQYALDFLRPYLTENPNNDALQMILAEIHEYRENFVAAIDALKKAKSIVLSRSNEGNTETLEMIKSKLNMLSEKV